MMVEDPNCPQQQPLSQIIKGVLGGLEPEETEVALVFVEIDEEAIVVEVAE